MSDETPPTFAFNQVEEQKSDLQVVPSIFTIPISDSSPHPDHNSLKKTDSKTSKNGGHLF